ncbi:hypothetical protein V1511DRAFT_506361 [Dipodascopsis uninucleata]
MPSVVEPAKASEDITQGITLGIDFTRSFADLKIPKAEADVDSNDSEGNGCCGGGCCRSGCGPTENSVPIVTKINETSLPNNIAFKSLRLPEDKIRRHQKLTGVQELGESNVEIEYDLRDTKNEEPALAKEAHITSAHMPPSFVTPHPPFQVHSIPVTAARMLTSENAPKRTYHFDLDVTNYPDEIEGVDFRVGGAVGICPPIDSSIIAEILERLRISDAEADRTIILTTKSGRWPTIWGDDKPRKLRSSIRELLTWTVDVNNDIISKDLLRLLAAYATSEGEKLVLLWLCSFQGQSTFCDLRSAAYSPTLLQLLYAFPSTAPPINYLLAALPPLMPRFYSLSSDPVNSDEVISCSIGENGEKVSSLRHFRKIEIAVTVHEAEEPWRAPCAVRPGNCTAFLEKLAKMKIEGARDISIPLFRGLQANPLAKEFRADGPMVLIGAGVGIAPFRGFVQRRLKNASCKNKVWVLQGCRDHLVDELYAGEWGVEDSEVRRVVESRRGTRKYVQDEVLVQGPLVWSVISHPDGRIFVCGSSKGMGEGVEEALIKVAMEHGNMEQKQAEEFWKEKERTWQYIKETW